MSNPSTSNSSSLNFDIVVTEKAFKSRILTIQILNNLNIKDPSIFLQKCSEIFPLIIKKINIFPCKINVSFIGEFIIPKVGDGSEENSEEIVSDVKYLNTKNITFFESSNPIQWFMENIFDKLLKKFSEFQESKSGWALTRILSLEVKINKCSLFSTSGTFVELPKEIKNKKACVNIKVNDGKCFAWAVSIHFQNVTRNVSKISSYKHFSQFLNLDGIKFPFSLEQLPKFEKQNNISINVFGLKQKHLKDQWYVGEQMLLNESSSDESSSDESEQVETNKKFKYEVLPIRISDEIKEKHVNLLMIQKKITILMKN